MWVPLRLLRFYALRLESLHVTDSQAAFVPGSKRSTPGSDRLVQCFQAVATFSVRSREFDWPVLSVQITRTVTVCADAPSAVPYNVHRGRRVRPANCVPGRTRTPTRTGRIPRLGSRTMSTSYYGRCLANLCAGLRRFLSDSWGSWRLTLVESWRVGRGGATRDLCSRRVRRALQRPRSGARASGSQPLRLPSSVAAGHRAGAAVGGIAGRGRHDGDARRTVLAGPESADR